MVELMVAAFLFDDSLAVQGRWHRRRRRPA